MNNSSQLFGTVIWVGLLSALAWVLYAFLYR